MTRKGNTIALVVFMIGSLFLVANSLINAVYYQAIFFTGFIFMLAGLLAKEYQHRLAPKLENTGFIIAAIGTAYWLYAVYL